MSHPDEKPFFLCHGQSDDKVLKALQFLENHIDDIHKKQCDRMDEMYKKQCDIARQLALLTETGQLPTNPKQLNSVDSQHVEESCNSLRPASITEHWDVVGKKHKKKQKNKTNAARGVATALSTAGADSETNSVSAPACNQADSDTDAATGLNDVAPFDLDGGFSDQSLCRELPAHVDITVFLATLEFAREVVHFGVGEGKRAHGFALVLCDPHDLMAYDHDGDPRFGSSHDGSILFDQADMNIQQIVDGQKRQVLNELNKDGMILINSMTGKFVASNWFFEASQTKADKTGGSRQKSASATSMAGRTNVVIKAGETECTCGKGKLDVFLGKQTATKAPIGTEPNSDNISPLELRQLGATASKLRGKGYSLDDLLQAGYSPSELIDAGFSCTDLSFESASTARENGLTRDQCLAHGFKPHELVAAGYPLSGACLRSQGEPTRTLSSPTISNLIPRETKARDEISEHKNSRLWWRSS